VTGGGLPPEVTAGGRFASWRPPCPSYVVCDVDGTLVGPGHHATDEVVAAVGRAQAAGIRVGIATGRMRAAVQPLRDQLDAAGPHVVFNGAEVRADGASVQALTLTPQQVDALLDLVRGRDDAYLEVYLEDTYLVSSWDERARPHWELLQQEPAGVIASASDLDGGPVMKANLALFDPAVLPDVVAAARSLGVGSDDGSSSPLTPHLAYVNVTHPAADKGRALQVAADHAGVALADVVAIGDASNDLSMLAVAGTGVAMGQAPKDVRDAAHLVVPAVDAHGVAVALDACVTWRELADR
jgi:Cof subfamily protein (haloacid dehalogenase superfamily)